MALSAGHVPRSRTYGYGERQLLKWGWAGVGPVVDLKTSDFTEDEVREWLTFVMKVAAAADDALSLTLNGPDNTSQ